MPRVLRIDDLMTHAAVSAGNLLDLRHETAFAAGHLPGAVSVPLEPEMDSLPAPHAEVWLADRLPSILLPPRHEPLLVIAESGASALLVATHLQARGRRVTDALAMPGAGGGPVRNLRLETGRSRRVLWSPPPFLRRWKHLLPPPAAGPVLDLACGSGRAAVWLARRGWRVTAVDHQPEALEMAERLAVSLGVSVDLRLADLRRPEGLPEGPWAAVLLFRFLDRALLERLPGVLAQGSVVMLRTFRNAPGYVGNPRPQHRLAAGEAAGWWPLHRRRVLVHEEGFDADGKPAAGVVVRWEG